KSTKPPHYDSAATSASPGTAGTNTSSAVSSLTTYPITGSNSGTSSQVTGLHGALAGNRPDSPRAPHWTSGTSGSSVETRVGFRPTQHTHLGHGGLSVPPGQCRIPAHHAGIVRCGPGHLHRTLLRAGAASRAVER